MSEKEIISIIGAEARFERVLERIPLLQKAYLERGFFFTRINVDTLRKSSDILISIHEGEPLRYGSVKLKLISRPEGVDPAKILGLGDGGGVFLPHQLEDNIEELLRILDREGYPFAQVWVESLSVDFSMQEVHFNVMVMDGGRKSLDRVVFEGLSRTRENIAVKLTGLKTGEPYDGAKVEESVKRLRAADVFARVSAPRVVLSPDGKGIETHIKIEEPVHVSSFAAAFGYAQAESNRPKVVSGFGRLELRNIAGTLKDLHVQWRNDGAGRSETKLSFLNRFIFNRPLAIGLTVEQIGLDTLYTWQSGGLELAFPIKTYRGNIAKIRLAFHGDRNVFSSGELVRSWRMRGSVGASYSLGTEGERGLDFRSMFTFAGKKSYLRYDAGNEFTNQVIIEVSSSFDFPVGPFVFHNFSLYRGLESNEDFPPISEQFYLGGASTLRGYRENQFHGQRTAFSRFELRFGGDAREHAYILADGGYIRSLKKKASGEVEESDLFRLGFGFGIRTVTRIGKVDLSFAVGEKLAIRQTKVHVILGYEF